MNQTWRTCAKHPAWINNHMPSKVWDVITYPFQNFNGCTVEVWGWLSNFISHFVIDAITYPYWKFIHVVTTKTKQRKTKQCAYFVGYIVGIACRKMLSQCKWGREWVNCVHWKPSVILMPTLSSLEPSDVVLMTTYAAASDEKVGIITTFEFQSCKLSTHVQYMSKMEADP